MGGGHVRHRKRTFKDSERNINAFSTEGQVMTWLGLSASKASAFASTDYVFIAGGSVPLEVV